MRVLFSFRNFWYVKIYESVIHELASRGHEVALLADVGGRDPKTKVWGDAARALETRWPGRVSVGYLSREHYTDWDALAASLRLGSDYLRYFHSDYAATPILMSRAGTRAPALVKRLAGSPLGKSGPGLAVLRGVLALMEAALPECEEVTAAVRQLAPDVVVLSPLLTLGSEQFEVLRSARRLGVHTALAVGSWDHLSSKALLRDVPERVLVWNEVQRDEAVRFHRIRPEQVDVTGAQCFDQWFDRQPSRDAATFKTAVGLDPARPYVLWACSCLFEGSPPESTLVERWVSRLRASAHPVLRDAGLLIRPHPKRAAEWASVDLDRFENVSVWPRTGDAPFSVSTKDDYFDSMYHSAAVVGLNSTALIEAGVVGRPVHTILLPEFHENQEGTLHFRYLLEEGGGLLQATRDLAAHEEALVRSISEPGDRSAFITRFVRPHGLERPATAVFADALERLATSPRTAAATDAAWVPALRAVMAPMARRSTGSKKVQRARLEQASRKGK